MEEGVRRRSQQEEEPAGGGGAKVEVEVVMNTQKIHTEVSWRKYGDRLARTVSRQL